MSFGVCQWNLGKGSLQPLLAEMNTTQPAITQPILGTHYAEFEAMLDAGHDDQLVWARSIQDHITFQVFEPWRGMFKTLGRTPEFQAVELKYAQQLYQDATALCRGFGVESERAVALLFDIKVQNGSITPVVQAQIQRDFAALDSGGPVRNLAVYSTALNLGYNVWENVKIFVSRAIRRAADYGLGRVSVLMNTEEALPFVGSTSPQRTSVRRTSHGYASQHPIGARRRPGEHGAGDTARLG